MNLADCQMLVRARAAARSGEGRALRIKSGLTQAEVAALCGVSGPAVARWEHGDRVPKGAPALRYGRLLDSLRHAADWA